MHQYLNAIGFGNIRSKKELNKVLVQVKSLFTQQDLISQDDDTDFCEFRKLCRRLCGETDGQRSLCRNM